ncbi:hypothetical protein [Streptomyces sp. GS7]|uniref:hypothetical protein n=1 Tax=Streptomyces sp. GS7 TaxID=2692234 RepID=UPI00191651D9|nr:hypothetical protein [Streptomyces sp. GS7]
MSAGIHLESGLTKNTWSDADFDTMGWHDVAIHGLCVQPGASDGSLPRLLLDIDYVVRRVHPVAPRKHFNFWIAPPRSCSRMSGTSRATSASRRWP